jgi:hypothetical protein
MLQLFVGCAEVWWKVVFDGIRRVSCVLLLCCYLG